MKVEGYFYICRVDSLSTFFTGWLPGTKMGKDEKELTARGNKMWRKFIGLALGLEILSIMLLSATSTPGVVSESPVLVSVFENPLKVTSVSGDTKVPPEEITVNSGEEMPLAPHNVVALEVTHVKPLNRGAYNNAAFDTFYAGFNSLSDSLCDLPIPEDPLNEAYLHNNSLRVTFLLKVANGLAGLIGQGNGFVQKAIFYDTLLYLRGCSITETYPTWTVTAGTSVAIIPDYSTLSGCCYYCQAFLPPAFPQITPVNKALASFNPLAKKTDKPQPLGLTDLTLILAAILAPLPVQCWLILAVSSVQGRQGLCSISKRTGRKDLTL